MHASPNPLRNRLFQNFLAPSLSPQQSHAALIRLQQGPTAQSPRGTPGTAGDTKGEKGQLQSMPRRPGRVLDSCPPALVFSRLHGQGRAEPTSSTLLETTETRSCLGSRHLPPRSVVCVCLCVCEREDTGGWVNVNTSVSVCDVCARQHVNKCGDREPLCTCGGCEWGVCGEWVYKEAPQPAGPRTPHHAVRPWTSCFVPLHLRSSSVEWA